MARFTALEKVSMGIAIAAYGAVTVLGQISNKRSIENFCKKNMPDDINPEMTEDTTEGEEA